MSLDTNPNAIDDATVKIFSMVLQLQEAIKLIDEKMVRDWVTDLIINKTYAGFRFQESILKRIAKWKGIASYKKANPQEESQGIDGFVGDLAISIKPSTYKTKNMLKESIKAKIVYYEKVKDGIKVDLSNLL